MALAIFLILAAIAGILYGIVKKRKAFVIAAVILLVFIAATMIYFYKNPY